MSHSCRLSLPFVPTVGKAGGGGGVLMPSTGISWHRVPSGLCSAKGRRLTGADLDLTGAQRRGVVLGSPYCLTLSQPSVIPHLTKVGKEKGRTHGHQTRAGQSRGTSFGFNLGKDVEAPWRGPWNWGHHPAAGLANGRSQAPVGALTQRESPKQRCLSQPVALRAPDQATQAAHWLPPSSPAEEGMRCNLWSLTPHLEQPPNPIPWPGDGDSSSSSCQTTL